MLRPPGSCQIEPDVLPVARLIWTMPPPLSIHVVFPRSKGKPDKLMVRLPEHWVLTFLSW
jgi:hypothetical protein